MHPYIKDKDYEYDFTNISGEVVHPNDWIIYKHIGNNKTHYTLAIDYTMVRVGGCVYGLSRYDIISSTDDIILQTNEDKSVCTITTDKYKYKFAKSENSNDIQNTIGVIYKTKNIEFISVELITKNNISSDDKYYLELDNNILNFFVDGVYVWSKIISLRYTSGIYFVLKDKIFTVMYNGCGILDVFNLDGSPYKQIKTSMEYIEHSDIIDDNEKYLKLSGFIWGPIYVRQYIDIESLFGDKLKQKTLWDGDDDEFDEDGLKSEDFKEDESANESVNESVNESADK